MALAHSKLTAQGQISVPAKVRSKLGVGPGGVLEWDEEDGKIVVRRAGRFSSGKRLAAPSDRIGGYSGAFLSGA